MEVDHKCQPHRTQSKVEKGREYTWRNKWAISNAEDKSWDVGQKPSNMDNFIWFNLMQSAGRQEAGLSEEEFKLLILRSKLHSQIFVISENIGSRSVFPKVVSVEC